MYHFSTILSYGRDKDSSQLVFWNEYKLKIPDSTLAEQLNQFILESIKGAVKTLRLWGERRLSKD